MFRYLVSLVVVLMMCSLTFAEESRKIVAREFSQNGGPPTFKHQGERLTLEVCRDTCDFYSGRDSSPESTLWDMVLLHQLYFNTDIAAAESFRKRYQTDGEAVMAQYGAICPKLKGKALAKCILDRMSKEHGVRLAFVRYDEGYRCEGPARITDPSWLSEKTRCTKLR